MSIRLTVLALGAILILAAGHPSAQNPTLKTAMHTKLVNAQRLLEAVVTADYAAMGRSVDALSEISVTGNRVVAGWCAPEYRKQAMNLVSSVQVLHEAAAAKNLDAVLTGYTALVSSCTRCHAHVRRMRTVSFEP